ncbi:efflux RND transporter permease subunit [Paenibacillus hunanensis]|uniref:efflux RND transporter permease subunit n=1 Tax=Paenibacillus hunanensis TaxID=539262 RepID=UPI002A6AA636|nr:efflux RND transporter permease subunit [Paenibacillus hunanensis]WPP43482.1 efflux RND transporter permease subunit [Paenibacillus hunanensis]
MIQYFVKKRKITILFFIMLIVVGIAQLSQLPKQLMPDVIIKTATVTTTYAGATPELMEKTVTEVLEQKIKEVTNLKKITSTSSNGVSSIVVQAEDDANATDTWNELRRKVEDAQAELPADADTPVVNDNLTQSFVKSYVIYSQDKQNLYALNDLMTTWQSQLRSVPGITKVAIAGIPEQQVRIQLNMSKLQQYGITWERVQQAIQGENNRIPTGNLTYDDRTYQITVDKSTDYNQLKTIVISQNDDQIPVYLQDVATIAMGKETESHVSYYNGSPAISIDISSQTGSDVPTMEQRLDAKMTSLEKTLPDKVKLEPLFAQNNEVDRIFKDLIKEMLIAIAAVILICTLGMNWLTAGFVALAIPISIALGLIFLPGMGISLNQITIVGLIIVLGILVDDAVVVNDNIERRLSTLGESPTDAAVKGTKEVAVSIITATLATISAFVPLMLLQGDMGSFIRPIPTVISLCMLASMIMSLTIIPIFRQWYEERQLERGNRHHDRPAGLLGRQIQTVSNGYAHRLMPRVLQKPLLIALIGLIVSTGIYGLAAVTPVELFPTSEDPRITVNVSLPSGTSLQATDKVTGQIAAWVRKQPDVERTAYAAGGGAPLLFSGLGDSSGGGVNNGQILVTGKAGMDIDTITEQWSNQLKQQFPGIEISVKGAALGVSVGKPVSIRIAGDNLEELRKLTNSVKQIISETPGTYGITDTMGNDNYALDFVVNKQAMDRYGVSYKDLTQTLLMMGSGINVGDLDNGQHLVDIKLYMNDAQSSSPAKLLQQVNVTNGNGTQVPLSQLVQMKPGFTIQQINRYDLQRVNTIEADVNGRTATEVMADMKPKLEQMNVPEGYTWTIGGETSDQADTFGDLGQLFVVAVFMIFILIVIQFYSLSIPFIIMTTVYLAAAGAVLGLFITRTPIGFMAIMGIIALAGIVVRNGIVLIEFIEDARHEGMELKEAVIQAASARFRPILLTSLTAIVGMIPIATIGELLFRPLGVVIIFGLIFSTVLTLFVVPSLYMVVAQWKEKRQWRKEERKQQRIDKHKQQGSVL